MHEKLVCTSCEAGAVPSAVLPLGGRAVLPRTAGRATWAFIWRSWGCNKLRDQHLNVRSRSAEEPSTLHLHAHHRASAAAPPPIPGAFPSLLPLCSSPPSSFSPSLRLCSAFNEHPFLQTLALCFQSHNFSFFLFFFFLFALITFRAGFLRDTYNRHSSV